jgi:hypothetical protein
MKPDRESASRLAEALDGEPDFATEHCDLTVGDRERGGPEGLPEPESPKGYGGADIHPRRSRRPRPGPKPKQVVMALQDPHPAPADAAAEPPVPELADPEPDFALEHRHLTAGGSDHHSTRRH